MGRRGVAGAALLALLMVTAVVSVLAGTSGDDAVAAPAAPARATVPSSERGAFRVTRNMTMNDPTNSRRGTIARQLRRYIAHTPRGATISITSFYLSSSITWPALKAAYQRGVRIRAVLYGGPDGTPMPSISWEGIALEKLIAEGRAEGRRGSFVVWTKRGARGKDFSDTVMHAKVWQFSQVGRTTGVTMIGSYNNGDPPDGRAYSAMVTLTDPKLYRVTQRMFVESARDRPVGGDPQRRFAGDGWDAYFFPSYPMTRENDPVLDRLRAIQGGEGTHMKIAMYSWQGRRGAWLAHRLAVMLEQGSTLTLVVGPDVERSVVTTLREAGARIEDGCWKSGRKDFAYHYTHDKEMTATWLDGGVRRYGAWIGSDDWGNGSGGSQSDQATVGLYSRWAYETLDRLLAPQIAHEPDVLTRCDPRRGRGGA